MGRPTRARTGSRGTDVERDGGVSVPPPVKGQPLQALLGPAAYRRLRDVLRREEGFDLDAYRSVYLARRVRARLLALDTTPQEYPERVEREPAERRALMEALGVNDTGFFRDPGVWAFLEDEALPPLVEQRAEEGRNLRGVSLGCAGGQEVYGLAMLLAELTLDLDVDFQLDAFDVDPEALALAESAAYPREAVENLSGSCVRRYFEETPGGLLRVREDLRSRVRVRRRDVLSEPLPHVYDFVLCRNVMIYFSRQAKERLLAKIHRNLSPDGLLVIGQSEVILGASSGLFQALSPRQRVYSRRVEP